MPLTRPQIETLRFALNEPVWILGNPVGMKRPNPRLPIKGAAAYTCIRSLERRGMIDSKTGNITESGRGNLIKDPQASSDPPPPDPEEYEGGTVE